MLRRLPETPQYSRTRDPQPGAAIQEKCRMAPFQKRRARGRLPVLWRCKFNESIYEADGMNWSEQAVLVTGGTGSFGKKFVEIMLKEYHPKRLGIFRRDELKQHDMRASGINPPSLRYFIGDVRDPGRLERAFAGVTVVVHAAALKQVPACEYNPFEAIQTNIMGGRNVIDAAINQGVHRVLALSTDKAVNPINLYGATKLCAEKMFVQANAYAGAQDSRFSCARYGNVVGGGGTLIPVFLEQRRGGRITVSDPRLT